MMEITIIENMIIEIGEEVRDLQKVVAHLKAWKKAWLVLPNKFENQLQGSTMRLKDLGTIRAYLVSEQTKVIDEFEGAIDLEMV